MSISKPRTGGKSPAAKHIKFKSGEFQYWDKEKEENITIPLPVTFIAIDELSAVTGWHEQSKSGIFSNEVGSTVTDELTVKAFKGGEIAKGLYGEIKDKCKAAGGRYEKSVYAVMEKNETKDGAKEGLELVRFGFVGSSLSAWIEKEVAFTHPKFTVSETKDGQKGATKYKIPIFEVTECTPEEWEAAVKVDKEILQPYLETKNSAKEADEVVPIPDDSHDVSEQNAQCAAEAGTPEAKQEVAEKVAEENIEIGELPF